MKPAGVKPARAEHVILVDHNDAELGTAEKMRAHSEARLHRAFSIFLVDENGALLLQQRAFTKYHSGGLWSNTCCSHPRPGESTHAAAHRRLAEEMGMRATLRTAFSFVYRAEVGPGLFEHEYDHVLIGRSHDQPCPNPAEVAAWRWQSPSSIRRAIAQRPGDFTCWFSIALTELLERNLLF